MRHEEILEGGNVTPVVRIGDTVRRAMGPWSPAVHMLLEELEAKAFDGAPRFLGIDDEGREVLSFVSGVVGEAPHLASAVYSDRALVALAKFLKRYHDATQELAGRSTDAAWAMPFPDARRHEVICHNGVAPSNTVFRKGRPAALIDFDMAGPGPRIWDLAYAAYMFVPLGAWGPGPGGNPIPYQGPTQGKLRALRLSAFLRAYGGPASERLLDTVVLRLIFLQETIAARADCGEESFRRMVQAGRLDYYGDEVAFIRSHAEDWCVE